MFVVCAFFQLLGLAYTGAITSESLHSPVLSVNKGTLVSLPSRLHGHIEQSNELELLRDGNCDMNFVFPSHTRFREVEWSRNELSWYPYDFDMGLVSIVEAHFEPGRKCVNDSAGLTGRTLLDVPVIFVEGEWLSCQSQSGKRANSWQLGILPIHRSSLIRS